MKLGKLPARHDSRTLHLARYLLPALPAPPLAQDFTQKVKVWPMMGNDLLGDCTIAAAGHAIEQWTTYSRPVPFVPSDGEIVQAYERIGGYVPADPSTDNGCAILDVLNAWRGAGIAGRKIVAYASLEPRNHAQVKSAVHLFGNAYIGLQLPVSAQGETVWVVPIRGANGAGTPGSWGGHCVIVTGYDSFGLTCITWGERMRMSWNFFDAYCDEAYAILSLDWLASTGLSPEHFNFAQLKADVAAL